MAETGLVKRSAADLLAEQAKLKKQLESTKEELEETKESEAQKALIARKMSKQLDGKQLVGDGVGLLIGLAACGENPAKR